MPQRRADIPSAAPERAAPLLSVRGCVLAVGLSFLLCWPMLLTGRDFIFYDTTAYLRGGETMWEMLQERLGMEPDAAALPALDPDDTDTRPSTIRSFVYSGTTFVANQIGGLWAIALLHGSLTLLAFFALVTPQALSRPKHLVVGAGMVGAFSTLPWYVVFITPDLWAAIVVLHGAILFRPFDTLGRWQKITLTAMATFATATHYGNLPLAVGLFTLVLAWRLFAGRLSRSVLLAAILPILFSPIANLTVSTVSLDTASVTPLRLPIVLARSLQDGPASWYLETACPEADHAICEVFGDEIPDSVPDFLWGEDGINSLTNAQLQRIRDEEVEILWQAFKRYPLAQTSSLFGNAIRQAGSIGLDELQSTAGLDAAYAPLPGPDDPLSEGLLTAFDTIAPLFTWLAAAGLGGMFLWRRLSRPQVEILFVVFVGLALNALVFGGLSAPADRYQGRVAWLLPALLVLFVAETGLRRRRDSV